MIEKKEIIKLIHKIALGPAPAPPPKGFGVKVDTPPPAPGSKSTPAKESVLTPSPSHTAVSEMQTAIQAFVNTVENQKSSMSAEHPSTPATTGTNPNKKNTDDFNNLLVHYYVSKSDVKGQEWTTDDKATALKNKKPTDLTEMSNILDNLKKMGGHTKEGVVDGRWGNRTQNSVRSMYAFADALIKITDDFATEKNPNDFNASDLSKMHENIPDADNPMTKKLPAELANFANNLTPLIKKLTGFYNKYVQSVLRHPSYVRMLEKGGQPLFKQPTFGEDPGDTSKYSQNLMPQIDRLPPLTNIQILNKDNKTYRSMDVPLNLLNPAGLSKILRDLGFDSAEAEEVDYKIFLLTTIMNQIEQRIKNPTMSNPLSGPGSQYFQPGGTLSIPGSKLDTTTPPTSEPGRSDPLTSIRTWLRPSAKWTSWKQSAK